MTTGASDDRKADNLNVREDHRGAGGTKKKATAAASGSKKSSIAGGADPGAPQYPDMRLCQRIHRLVYGARGEGEPSELEVQVFDQIVAMKNPSLYAWLQRVLTEKRTAGEPATALLAASTKLTADDLASVTSQNDVEMKELQEKLSEAKESAGEMEVLDAKVEIARFAAARLDKDAALARYQDVIDTPKLGGGKKIDAWMEKARIASFYGDTAGCDAHLAAALKLANDSAGGGDWDRRNRLKVYQALQFLLHRDFAQASKLLLDGVATFSRC
jgi:26S proteasome regulatory subunit N7